jgi:hypothetical protein
MRDHRIGLDLVIDVLDVLERHGFARGDDEHTGRAIVLLGDLARTYEGSEHGPFGPFITQTPSRPAPDAGTCVYDQLAVQLLHEEAWR